MALLASGAGAASSSAEVTQALQSGALNGGISGLLGQLRVALAREPALVATPDAARALADAAALEIARFPLADETHFGAAGAIIAAAAPVEQREAIAAVVMESMVSTAGEDRRAAVQAQVIAAVSDVTGMAPERAAEKLKEEAARRQTVPRPQAVAPAPQPEPESLGLRAGPVVFYPRFLVAEIYDTNIFATQNNTVDDFITVVSPSLFVETDTERHYFSFETGTDLAYYSGQTRENSQDYYLTAEGRIDIGEKSNLFGGVWASRDHEDRESSDDVNGAVPTRYYDTQAHAGLSHQMGPVALRLGGTFQRLNYRNVDAALAVINNDDRDRELYTGGARLTYVDLGRLQPFVQASYDQREYSSPFDDFGFDRDSDGYRASIGTRYTLRGKFAVEAFGGWMAQDYDDQRFSDPSTPTLGASLEWLPTPLITVTGYADRTIEETTTFGASSYIYSVFGGAVDWEVLPKVLLNVNAQFGQADFEGISRTDNLYAAGVGVRYTFTPRLFLEGEYAFRDFDSGAINDDFTRSLFFLRVGAQL